MIAGAQRVIDRSPLTLLQSQCELRVSPFVVEPMVRISGINEAVCQETLELFFESEKRSGGGEIKAVDIYLASQMAIITFENEEGNQFCSSHCTLAWYYLFTRSKKLSYKRSLIGYTVVHCERMPKSM